ncbi:hypothetical protein [Nocardia sp. NPDC051570]|uniref:hypothetical protein n=1 Tax=Nocardia sp. NPDC051570 TaxID=3364324 RepID=UPI0037895E05
MRLVGCLTLGIAAVACTAFAYANAAGPSTTTAPSPPTTTAPTTTVEPTTVPTTAPPTTTPPPTTPTTIIPTPPTIVPSTTTTTPPPPTITPDPGYDDGITCGPGFNGLEVRAIDIFCDTALQVTDAYGREVSRWNYGIVITVEAAGRIWDCQQLHGVRDPYQECVDRDRPSDRARLLGTAAPAAHRDSGTGVPPGSGSAGR